MRSKLLKAAISVALCNGVLMASYISEPAFMAKAEGDEPAASASDMGISEASDPASEEVVSSEEASSEEISSEAASSSAGTISKEEEQAWKDIEEYIKELERQIENFNSTKFLNGTIGGLISSALTLLLYAVLKLAEKKGWKTRTELFSRANGLLDNVQSKVDDLHATQRISEEQYKAATKAVTDATQLLNETNEKLNDTDGKVDAVKAELEAKYNETMESVKKDYDVLLAKYEKLLSMFLEMAKSSSDMVKSGAYERMVEINSASDSTEGE